MPRFCSPPRIRSNPTETLCNSNKKPLKESRLLLTCYGQHLRYSNQFLSRPPTKKCCQTRAYQPWLSSCNADEVQRSWSPQEKGGGHGCRHTAMGERGCCVPAERGNCCGSGKTHRHPCYSHSNKIHRQPPIITPPANPTTSVASQLSTTNLNSLLSIYVGKEGSGADANTSTIAQIPTPTRRNLYLPPRKKRRNPKTRLHPTAPLNAIAPVLSSSKAGLRMPPPYN